MFEPSAPAAGRGEIRLDGLRVESPAAEGHGHAAHETRRVAGKAAIRIVGSEPVGNYAVRLVFDDGHSTGLFSWSYLRHLGERQDEIMSGYLRRLAEAGLSRE